MTDLKTTWVLAERASREGTTVQDLVEWALLKRGSIQGAARELDVAPNTIRYHMEQFGIRLTKQVRLEKVG